MSSRKQAQNLPPPYLKRVTVDVRDVSGHEYPNNIPVLNGGRVSFELSRPICIISGDNGVGKSSLLEAIAVKAGFSTSGGTQNYQHINSEADALSPYTTLSWLPKVNQGFFFRAETFFNFSKTLDALADETGSDLYSGYGGKSLMSQSHGQAFLSLFNSRLGTRGVFLLDEPEAALSPTRLIEFIKVLRNVELSGIGQVIVVTHSPIIMAYPRAQFIYLSESGPSERNYAETEHFEVLKSFFEAPGTFMRNIVSEVDREVIAREEE